MSDTSPAICRHLRGKNAYGTNEGGPDPWILVDTGTTIYTCRATLQSWGPDRGLASYQSCRPGRSCFAGVWMPPEGTEPKVDLPGE